MKNKIFSLSILILLLAFITVSCSKDESPENTPPTASFTIDPSSGNTETDFTLDASASTDTESPASELLLRWDLNDDGTWETEYTTDRVLLVQFLDAGDYTIRLEVKDGGGMTGSTTKQVSISGNMNPVSPSDPNPADQATEIPVDASLTWTSSDPDQDPLTFDVYFGNVANPPLAAEGINTMSYDPGVMGNSTIYYWKIVAHDDKGNSTEGPVWQFTTATMAFSCGDNVTDTRNGMVYPTVQIGTYCWMAKNMNIGELLNGSEEMTDDGNIEKYCFDNDEANCTQYGGLYQWDEVLQYDGDNVKGICPDGWHIPSLEEWQQLEMALGMPEDQATASSGWQGTDEGSKLKQGGSSGFNALMTGNRNTSGNFTIFGSGTAFWTATQASSFMATARTLDASRSDISHTNYDKRYGHAIRCVENQQ